MKQPFESFGYVAKPDYAKYVRFNMLKGKYHRPKAYAAAFVLTVAVVALAVAGVNSKNTSLLILSGILLLCAGMFAYVIKITVNNICAKNAKAVRGKQHVLFGKNGFIFELLYKNEADNEYTDVLFEEIDSVFETKGAAGYFYIYIDKRTVIIVPKRNLRIDPLSAREYIQELLPEKFFICV